MAETARECAGNVVNSTHVNTSLTFTITARRDVTLYRSFVLSQRIAGIQVKLFPRFELPSGLVLPLEALSLFEVVCRLHDNEEGKSLLVQIANWGRYNTKERLNG